MVTTFLVLEITADFPDFRHLSRCLSLFIFLLPHFHVRYPYAGWFYHLIRPGARLSAAAHSVRILYV